MLVVLAVVSVFATMLLLPGELLEYGKTLGFSALFMGNIHFWLQRGAYAESEHEVLLHMWTLGVEGQFYLLLPLIVLGLMKLGRWGLWFGLVALAAGSAAVSLQLHPTTSFYLLPARLWEFLAGMMVAITPLPFLKARWVRECLALAGLALILYAASAFRVDMPYPGWRAAVPCIGAAAIIAAGSSGASMVGALFAFAPVRFVGKISYSLYLWHWPVIVLLLLGLPAGELDGWLQLLAIAISFALAVLSWRYVEEPFRRGGFPRRPLLLGSAAVTAGLIGAAVVLTLTSGMPQRFSERSRDIAAAMDYPLDDVLRSGQCFIHHRSQRFDADACLEQSTVLPEVMLLGDSHAAHLGPGLRANFPGSAISQITAAGCRPVMDRKPTKYPFCIELMDWAFAEYIPENKPDLVVLSGRWTEDDLPALGNVLAMLRDQRQAVLLVGPTAEWAQFVPRLLVLAHERGEGAALPDALLLQSTEALDRKMALLAAQMGADYVSLYKIQCVPECRYYGQSGVPLVVDDSHYTLEASRLFTSKFKHSALVAAPTQ
jgi:peptidoglycan/LPS O-acetylase OafA/YrhL